METKVHKGTAFTSLFMLSLSLFAIIACCVISSCSDSAEEPSDPKEMRDETGLQIDLEWSTGSSSSQSLDDVDLDLKLLKGTSTVESSLNYFSYERIQLKDIYSDGEYIIEISVEYAKKASSYTVFFNGIKSGETKKYDGTVTSSEQGSKIEFIRITKQGTKYILSR